MAGASGADGTPVQQWSAGGNQPQQLWEMQAEGDGIYHLKSKLSPAGIDKVIGVADGSLDNGAPVVLWFKNGSKDQLWQLDPV